MGRQQAWVDIVLSTQPTRAPLGSQFVVHIRHLNISTGNAMISLGVLPAGELISLIHISG